MNELNTLQERILRILYKHTKDEDVKLSDREFIRAIYLRWEKYLLEPIIDIGE